MFLLELRPTDIAAFRIGQGRMALLHNAYAEAGNRYNFNTLMNDVYTPSPVPTMRNPVIFPQNWSAIVARRPAPNYDAMSPAVRDLYAQYEMNYLNPPPNFGAYPMMPGMNCGMNPGMYAMNPGMYGMNSWMYGINPGMYRMNPLGRF